MPAKTRFTTDYDFNTCLASLKIEDARPSDVGVYLMVAENIVGKDDTSCEAFVLNTTNVDQRPLIDPQAFINLEKVPEPLNMDQPEQMPEGRPPVFIIHLPNQLKLYNGEKVRVNCKVKGYPLPKV